MKRGPALFLSSSDQEALFVLFPGYEIVCLSAWGTRGY